MLFLLILTPTYGILGLQDAANGRAPSASPPTFNSLSSSPLSTPMFSPFDPDSPFATISPATSPRVEEASNSFSPPINHAPSPHTSPSSSPRSLTPPTTTPLSEPSQIQPTTATSSPAVATSATPSSSSAGPSEGLSNVTFHARKKGGNVKNWKNRYWLFEPAGGMLSYYEDQSLKVRKGHVDLSQCTGIGPVRHERIPHTLGLRTKDRLWVLAFDTADELGRIQTLLGSVVQGFLEVQDVPVSTLTKIKRGFTKKSHKSTSSSNSASNERSRSPSPAVTASHIASTSSSHKHHEEPARSVVITSNESSVSSAAATNEKAALSSLLQNLNRIKSYTGKEFTLECDMSVVRARLESDHPDKKDVPGDIIYAGFMGALAGKFQELCDYHLYREVINHKCSGRIAIRVSDEEADRRPKTPFLRLDSGTLVIVCHRSLLTSSLIELGDDFLDVLSVGEPLHVAALKDIEDHKQGIKSCLIKIQSNFGLTCQFECDYTEGFRTLSNINPTAAAQYNTSWGEIIYKYLESVTSKLLKIAAENPESKAKIADSIPSRSIRVSIASSDYENRPAWVNTDGGSLNIVVNAYNFSPEKPVHFPTW